MIITWLMYGVTQYGNPNVAVKVAVAYAVITLIGQAARWLTYSDTTESTRRLSLLLAQEGGSLLGRWILDEARMVGAAYHVDADFCGAWDPDEVEDPNTARSRTGYCITYAGCPIYWTSKLQGEHCLSSTESEYIALSESLRSVIPMMKVSKEMSEQGISMITDAPKIHCKVFEDNSGCLEMATVHKFRPRTKHLCVKWHHFRSYVTSGLISIHKCSTEWQAADVLTKPLSTELVTRHRKTLQGW